jgi:hypothetical protein
MVRAAWSVGAAVGTLRFAHPGCAGMAPIFGAVSFCLQRIGTAHQNSLKASSDARRE